MSDKKRMISGPGASDFIAAPGGADLPGASPGKGTTELRDEAPLTDPKNLEPAPAPEVEPPKRERQLYTVPERADEERKKENE